MSDAPASSSEAAASPSQLAAMQTCHCLTIDGSKFAAGSEEAKQYAAMTNVVGGRGGGQVKISAEEVRRLLPALEHTPFSCAFLESSQQRIHIVFSTLADLAVALERCPQLVRCGTLPFRWKRVQCGRTAP